MWYRLAKKYNMFGLPISGDRKFNLFADEDTDETETAETPLELPEEELPEEDIRLDVKTLDGLKQNPLALRKPIFA